MTLELGRTLLQDFFEPQPRASTHQSDQTNMVQNIKQISYHERHLHEAGIEG